jgi:hypothetical protein
MVLEAAPAEEPATVSATAPALVIVAERLQATAIAKAELLAVMFSTGSLQLLLEQALAKFEELQEQRSKLPQL